MEYKKRHLEKQIIQANKGFPVILLTGARQVGKSTLFHHLSEKSKNINRQYVTLDDPNVRLIAQTQPDQFLELFKPPIIIDEIQYAPELFPYIKIYVDQNNQPGLFWLTGSQVFQLMTNVQESLAGRVAVFNMFPFSQSEIWGIENKIIPFEKENLILEYNSKKEHKSSDVNSRILNGGMPRFLYNDNIDREIFYSSYLQTYIERDVKQITNILDTNKFLTFVRLLATRTAQELNATSIGSAIAVDSTTVKRWIDLLLLSGIIFELPAWSKNIGKRLIKRPKIYFTDTGLCCYLCGINSIESLKSSINSGALFENYVVVEIFKTWINQGKRSQIFYYRDINQKEIDLIIEKNQHVYPIEIKQSTNPKNAFKNMKVLDRIKIEIPYYAMICQTEIIIPLENNRWLIPWWMI